jgi:hypothetical protein
MTRFKAAVIGAGLICFTVSHGVLAGETTSPDDTARFLAGLEVSAESPIAKFTRDPGWQQHARSFEAAWKELNRRQISKIRASSDANLKERRPTLFYMFSGPDFLYADAFFPNASTYILAGLEPVGALPEITERSRHSLSGLRSSLTTILDLSFFITKHMRGQLSEGQFRGTLPILYVFLARAGKTVREVSLFSLDKDGSVQPAERGRASQAQGAKIVFSGSDGKTQVLYYFRTDLSESGVKNSGFLKFCEKLAPGDSLLKSASYLLHREGFASVRRFLLDHSQAIVQDDSGIPLRAFKADDWNFYPFGTYLGPIEVFLGMGQPKLRELFRKGNPPKLEFGVGYRWRGPDSNLLLAVKKSAPAPSH